MNLTINGKERHAECANISGLLDRLSINKDTVAVELNKNIVHRQNFDITKLKNKDKLEIVTVVGGG